MATIHLTSCASPDKPHAFDQLDRMRASAAADRFGVHRLTDDPLAADLVLFVDPDDPAHVFFRVRQTEAFQAHPERCFLFSRHDFPVPYLPGIYASLSRRWHNRHWARSGPYLRALDDGFIRELPPVEDPSYLYSFVGKQETHSVRGRMFDLHDPRMQCVDTTAFWPYGEQTPETQQRLRDEYIEVARDSAFILCPRGLGTSSIRLFETLRMGRAPVIIADDWVPPEGPDWDACSVRVPEAKVLEIPRILREREADAAALGRAARTAWTEWFARDVLFHRTAEACLDMQQSRRLPLALNRLQVLPHLTRPSNLRSLLRASMA